ncbi:hypothetical protein HAPAU_06240 [Halalkalicoccus paucihalophilus]|uniref:Uncharacterized protein n=1 Tax=Halalkalicoccus paucihalophilus TaxID=1008153 RepID=A0A151AHW4_9EURY|nr:hypothetical protein HAPAU_06240 [Halalkalicoccus paucihalophilus]
MIALKLDPAVLDGAPDREGPLEFRGERLQIDRLRVQSLDKRHRLAVAPGFDPDRRALVGACQIVVDAQFVGESRHRSQPLVPFVSHTRDTDSKGIALWPRLPAVTSYPGS